MTSGWTKWFGMAIGLGYLSLLGLPLPLFAQKREPACTAIFKGVRPQEVALSPCEKYLAVAGYQGGTDEAIALLIVWDLKTKKEVFRHRDPEGGFGTVSFSPNGKFLAGGGFGSFKTSKVWEFPSGKEIARLKNNENVDSLRFSPDGKVIAMATFINEGDGYHPIILWDTVKFQKKSVLKGPERLILSLAFSPDGKLLASGDAFGDVHLWNVKDEKHLGKISGGSNDWANRVCFSNNGKILVSVHDHGRIRLFDLAKAEEHPTVIRGQEGGIRFVLFSGNDRWLFTGGQEFPPFKDVGNYSTVQVWNVAEKKLHAKLKNHFPMALSRDGQTLIVKGMEDATVKVLNLPKEFYEKQ